MQAPAFESTDGLTLTEEGAIAYYGNLMTAIHCTASCSPENSFSYAIEVSLAVGGNGL
jgi:hypothetical protein